MSLRRQALRLYSRARRRLGMRPVAAGRLPLMLALQGGGAHGAFTWGVLDRLLEQRALRITALSGASAGAMNAAVAATGWVDGAHEGAREALEAFWRAVSWAGGPKDLFLSGRDSDLSPGYLALRGLTRFASPYQFNPSGFSPLADILARHVDFDALRHPDAPRVVIALTNVHSGQLRLVENHGLCPRALEASACLPMLFQAVELDGQYYWDGGYSANPPLLALARQPGAGDILLVQLNPVWRDEVPTQTTTIADRLDELAFNASLVRELEMFAELQREPESRFARVRLHRIAADGAFDREGRSGALNTQWEHLTALRDQGRQRAAQWLADHGAALGQRASLDLRELGAGLSS